MKIVSSAVAMQSQHTATVRTEESERLRVWTTPPQATAPAARAPATTKAMQPADSGDAVDEANWRLLLIKAFLEWLTGKPITLFDTSQLQAGDASGTAPSVPNSAPATPMPAVANARRRSGFGVEYEFHASRQETEQMDFAAQGAVTTADGRRIDFAVDVAMSRSYSEHSDVALRAGSAPRRKDPLVVNLGGAPASLSGQRMNFDIDADGQTDNVAVLAGGSAYLALDLNGNGKIDSGAELFGPSTGSGFGELAKYDSDGNGWIDENDPVFKQLRLWKPSATGNGELSSLKDQDVGALCLSCQETSFQLRGARNEDLGAVRASGIYLTESGQAGSVQQIDLTA